MREINRITFDFAANEYGVEDKVMHAMHDAEYHFMISSDGAIWKGIDCQWCCSSGDKLYIGSVSVVILESAKVDGIGDRHVSSIGSIIEIVEDMINQDDIHIHDDLGVVYSDEVKRLVPELT